MAMPLALCDHMPLRNLYGGNGLPSWLILFGVLFGGLAVALQSKAWHDWLLGFFGAPVYLFVCRLGLIGFDQFVLVVPNAKLKLQLSGEEFENAVLPHFFADFVGAIDAEVGENIQEGHHEVLLVVAVGVADQLRRLAVGAFVELSDSFELGDSQKGVQFHEVDEGELDVEGTDVVFQQGIEVRRVVVQLLHKAQ